MEGPPLRSFDWTMGKKRNDVGHFFAQICFFFNFRRSEFLQNCKAQQAAKTLGAWVHKQRTESSLPTENYLKKAPLTAKNAFGVIGAKVAGGRLKKTLRTFLENTVYSIGL